MKLLSGLWEADQRRAAVICVLVPLGAVASAAAAILAGETLAERELRVFLGLAGALLLYAGAEVGAKVQLAHLSIEWARRTRAQLTATALRQPLTGLDSTPAGELIDRIDDDLHQVAQILQQTYHLATGIVGAFVGAIVAWFVWAPAGAVLTFALLVVLVGLRPLALRIRPARVAQEEGWSDLAATMEEGVHGQDDIRTALGQPYMLGVYARRTRELLERARRAWAASAVFMGAVLLVVRLSVLAVALGALWSDLGVARSTAVWFLALSFGISTEVLARQFSDLQAVLGAWTRVQLLAGVEQEPAGGSAVPSGSLEISGLSFSYGEREVLHEISLTLLPGRTYALVGRSGSGKTTLTRVLTRAVEVPRGTVYLGGSDLTDLQLRELRRSIATVTQRTEILAATLRENITLLDPALEGRVEAAIASLGLEEWMASLPAGLDTVLGEQGVRLSAGEEQLVAFARVLVRDPAVVILDEATARMDPATEARVERATRALTRERIALIIAHRLSTVEHADEVIVMSQGRVLEAGPLQDSARFAHLLELAGRGVAGGVAAPTPLRRSTRREDPPAPAPTPQVSTLRAVGRLLLNDRRYGLLMIAFFTTGTLLGLDGAVLGYLWAYALEEGTTSSAPLLLTLALLLAVPVQTTAFRFFPEWWVRQILRIRTNVLAGQTGPVRRSKYSPGEVVALTNDCDRIITLADNMWDTWMGLTIAFTVGVLTGSAIAVGVFLSTLVCSAGIALLARSALERRAEASVESRNRYASALGSLLGGARTLKLAAAEDAALTHLSDLDAVRSRSFVHESTLRVYSTAAPGVLIALASILAWGLYLRGELDRQSVLVTVTALGAVSWFGWVVANLITGIPGARVWAEKVAAMTGRTELAAAVEGVDVVRGTAAGASPPGRTPLQHLELRRLRAVHEDGTVGVWDVDIVLKRGELVLLTGSVGSGKSSCLRALAGLVHHEGEILWNGEVVTDPAQFLRPGQVSYVAQLPRVVSGSFAENIALGYDHDVEHALARAQLRGDVASAGGAGTLIGHRGTRLSGGQLQRVALARALAPEAELLVADDISSALDVETEVALWQQLRESGTTVVGSSFKRAALALADQVIILDAGAPVARGPWRELEAQWGHLAG